MKRIVLSLLVFSIVCALWSCSKKDDVKPMTVSPAVRDSVKQIDSVIVPRPEYPYEDTFVGILTVAFDPGPGYVAYNPAPTTYTFYARHITRDSLVFVGRKSIRLQPIGDSVYINQGFNTGYDSLQNNVYHSAKYSISIHQSAMTLSWSYFEEMRGVCDYGTSNGTFTGMKKSK